MIIDGFLKGNNWNKETKTWDILKLGEPDNGALIVGLGVSGKDKDGKRVYGKAVKVKINIKSRKEGERVLGLIEDGTLVEFDSFFVPDNFTNKEGKEIQGNMLLCWDSTTLVEKQMNQKKESSKPTKKEEDEESPW